MASEPNAPRSRRALLTAAAGGAAAVAATAAMPFTAAAADGGNVVLGAQNDAETETTITTTTAGAAEVSLKVRTVTPNAAALLASTGDETGIATDTAFTGVYGWAPEAPFPADPQYEGSGVWGDSPDDGVVGSGGLSGVLGLGGSEGVFGIGSVDGVVGQGGATGAGVRAIGANTRNALVVSGKVQFSRSGRATIGTGKSSVKVNLLGASSSSRVFAVLHSNRSGRYVRAVVPTTGSFTIYLNTTVTSSTYVAWFVIN